MAFLIRKVGGGHINSSTLTFDPSNRFLFAGFGSCLHMYSVPDLTFLDSFSNQNVKITALATSPTHLIIGDENGQVRLYKYHELTLIKKNESSSSQFDSAIEKNFISKWSNLSYLL